MGIPVATSKAQFDDYIAKNELVMVKFTAAWCGPCKMIAPIIEGLYKKTPEVEFVEVDVDKSKDIAQQYGISSMPTFVFLQNGQEVSRAVGADPNGINTNLQQLKAKNPNASRASEQGESAGAGSSSSSSAVSKFVAKGFSELNSLVFAPDAEILNAEEKNRTDLVKKLLSAEGTQIQSDADSQLLIYLPLQNKTKVHSLVLKSVKPSTNDDEDTQLPTKIKVWANTAGPISFEDASSGLKALHQSDNVEFDEDGYAKIELRYVLFQSTGSLLIFLDGEDEDASTVINQISIIGNPGEQKNQGKLQKLGEDE